MNSRRLWKSHQSHKLLRAEASRDILKFRVLEMPCPGVFKRYFPPQTPCFFIRIYTRIQDWERHRQKMSQAFHNIAQLEHFTDLNLFKYMFSVIQKWATDALQFYSMRLIFLLAVMVEGYESTGLSLRAGGWGFSPATKRVAPGYFYWKIEEK